MQYLPFSMASIKATDCWYVSTAQVGSGIPVNTSGAFLLWIKKSASIQTCGFCPHPQTRPEQASLGLEVPYKTLDSTSGFAEKSEVAFFNFYSHSDARQGDMHPK